MYRKLFVIVLSQLSLFSNPLCAAKAETPVRIGVSVALTGVAAEFGNAVRSGIELATEDSPETFGGMKFIFADDRYEPIQAVRNFHQFRSDNVSLIFVAGVAPSQAVASLASRYKLPLIINCQDPTVGLANPYVIRSVNASDQYSEQTLVHLRRNGHKHLALIATTSSYTAALITGLKKHLQPDEQISLLEHYELNETDFRGIIAKLKTGKFDAIGVYLFPGQLSLFFRQANEQQLKSPIFGPDTFESAAEIQNAFGGLDGAIFASNPIDSAFKARYKRRFKNDAQLTTAANAYDMALLIGDTMRSNPELSSKELLHTLSQTVDREGVSGKFSFRDSETFGRFFDFAVVVKTIDGGQIRSVD